MEVRELQELVRAGRYLAALRQAAPVAMNPAISARERTEAALVAARGAIALEMFDQAKHLSQIARDQAPDRELRTQALHYLGAALVHFDPEDAEGVLLEALAQEDVPYLARVKPQILHNLALAYERRREEMAPAIYRQAAREFQSQGKTHLALRSLQNAAWLLLLQGRQEEGRKCLAEAAAYLDDADPCRLSHQQALESYALMHSEQNHDAIALAEELLQPGRSDATPWARGLAAIIAAEVSRREGMPAFAVAILEKAQGWVTEAGCSKLCNLLAAQRRRLQNQEGGDAR